MTHIQPIEIGDKLHLFAAGDTQGERPRRLVVTAHGGSHDRAWLTVPRWTTICLYAAHGVSLEEPGTKSFLGSRPWQEQGPGTTVPSYVVGAPQERRGGADIETYDGVRAGLQRAHELHRTARESAGEHGGRPPIEPYDVLVVRARRLRSELTLRDVLRELEDAHRLYPEIHCCFCRGPMRLPFLDRRGEPRVP